MTEVGNGMNGINALILLNITSSLDSSSQFLLHIYGILFCQWQVLVFPSLVIVDRQNDFPTCSS